jgi:hypothetical protein
MLRSSVVLVLIGYGCWRGATLLGLKWCIEPKGIPGP